MVGTPFLLLLLAFTIEAQFIFATDSAETMDLILLKDAPVSLGARCIDGTPPAYYFIPGTGDGANKWFIFHEGGGWCTSIQNCYQRSRTTLGSSSTYPAKVNLPGGYFSPNPTENPTSYNWNKVYLKYCDGGSFSGNNGTVTTYQGNSLYFRGYRNLQAYLKDLQGKGLVKAEEVIISGCSAGGLATYLHVDWWAQQLPRGIKVRGMPDSGFFLDYDSTHTPKYGHNMRWVFTQMNATDGVNQACIAANKGTEANCFFAEHTSPHIQIPIFPLQSIYDAWQKDNVLGSNNVDEFNAFGKSLIQRFRINVLNKKTNGAFLESCFHHCGEWNSITIRSLKSGAAFDQWYKTGNGVFLQEESYPCEACCH